jgi:hypothetical protein
MNSIPKGGNAVMASRIEAPDSLDYFPTPPWAVRAFCHHALELKPKSAGGVAWDPACGEGHMAHGLAEYFNRTFASDIFDYGVGYPRGDFLDGTLGTRWTPPEPVDWIITNPPFNKAAEFLRAALALKPAGGVAMIMRTVWLESAGRYREIFSGAMRPTAVYISADRIPMIKGRYDHTASSATSYSWFVWEQLPVEGPTGLCDLGWIPPGCRERFFDKSDVTIGGGA